MSEKYMAFENSLSEMHNREKQVVRSREAYRRVKAETTETLNALKTELDEAVESYGEARAQTYRRAIEAHVITRQLVDMLVPTHGRRECNDNTLENAYDSGDPCVRCVLLKLIRDPLWSDPRMLITLSVRRDDG